MSRPRIRVHMPELELSGTGACSETKDPRRWNYLHREDIEDMRDQLQAELTMEFPNDWNLIRKVNNTVEHIINGVLENA